MPMKYGEKQYDSEESKRETYNPFGESGSGQDPSLSSIFGAFDKNLISVCVSVDLLLLCLSITFFLGYCSVSLMYKDRCLHFSCR